MIKEYITFKGKDQEVTAWESFSEFLSKYDDVLVMDPGIHKVLIDFDGFELPLYFYLRLTKDAPLLVSYHGANDQKNYPLPRVDGIGISENLKCSLLAPCDPLLYMSEDLKLTWYTSLGKDPLYLINKLASFIRVKSNANKTVFYGSSGGGYAAIKSILYPALTQKRPTGVKEFDTLPLVGRNLTAVAINPQLNIKDFCWPNVVKDFFDLPQNQVDAGSSEDFFNILSFRDLPVYLKKSNSLIYYFQQEQDIHVLDQLVPFLENNLKLSGSLDPQFSGWVDSRVFLHIGRWKENISIDKVKNHVRPPRSLIKLVVSNAVSGFEIDSSMLREFDCIKDASYASLGSSSFELIKYVTLPGVVDFSVNDITDACLKLAKDGHHKHIERIIYDKNCRPLNLSDQYSLLLNIYRIEDLPLNIRLNACIAASHKAMECMQACKVYEITKLLDDSFRWSSDIGFSEKIREDRTHIVFSFFSVRLHLCLWNSDFSMLTLLSKKLLSYYQGLNFSELTGGFYQTCTNVARCLALSLISVFIVPGRLLKDLSFLDINKKLPAVTKHIKFIRDAMSTGLSKADSNQVKFNEFERYLKIYNVACKVKVAIVKKNKDALISHIEELYLISLRPHGKEKYEHLHSVLRRILV